MTRKCLLLLVTVVLFSFTCSYGQATVGVYKQSFYTQLGVGTNPEAKYFGEARLFAGDFSNRFFGLEAIGQYNFSQTDWYNLSGGLMVGYHEFEDFRAGLHGALAIKPIENHRNLAIILETTPFYRYQGLSLRAGIGIRYTFGRRNEP